MNLPLKRTLDRLPGGMMIVPLILGALINTLAPQTATYFGSFTGALFTGALPILAVLYVCIGSTISVRGIPTVIRKGGVLLVTKLALGVIAGTVLGHFLGEQPVTSGWFTGLSTLAVVAAFNDTNGGLYMALMKQFGTDEDAAAYSLMSLESGPFFTMVTLGVAGLAAFPGHTLVGAILPLLVGIVLGNLDSELREFLGRAPAVLIPFFAFALGAGLDFHLVWRAGVLGLILGVSVVVISGIALFSADKLIGGTGTAGLAAASTAGNAAAVPALVASANPAYAAAAAPATVLVAACIIISGILVPIVTAWSVHMRQKSGRA